jgi:hypothetical protein
MVRARAHRDRGHDGREPEHDSRPNQRVQVPPRKATQPESKLVTALRSLANKIVAEGGRKPDAQVVTAIMSLVYVSVTGEPARRVVKQVAHIDGLQECGPFKEFLEEAFAILGVKASAGGQVQTMMRRRRRPR